MAAPAILIPALTALVAQSLPIANAVVSMPDPVMNISQSYAEYLPKAMPAYSCSAKDKKKDYRVSFAEEAEVSTFSVAHDMERTQNVATSQIIIMMSVFKHLTP